MNRQKKKKRQLSAVELDNMTHSKSKLQAKAKGFYNAVDDESDGDDIPF